MLFYNGATWINSPAQSVVSYQAVTNNTAIDFARTIILEPTSAGLIHTLADSLGFNARCNIINTGAVDTSVTASGTTQLIPAGTDINLVFSINTGWLIY